ncbi:alpha/beta hydrolase family protein [Pinirhizobacter soli]|uniref:alpha/beta hydrolase family protein n=1 Tax=Pinirhizobacter soli TaxID=2786953 RepID=UPI002029FE19|nr:alpha/beta hydrolase [Pinirhizobacter soli]
MAASTIEPCVIPVTSTDRASAELILVRAPAPLPGSPYLLWLPALGVPARHYLPLAQAVAGLGVGVALHEWRGLGSSDRRAGRRCDWGYRQLLNDIDGSAFVAAAAWPGSRWWVGGHSLGGQFACLMASRAPASPAGILLAASGAPYWRCFAHPNWVRLAYLAAPWLARLVGYLPGRRIGFGGNEARGVISDWAATGRTGRYGGFGINDDLECSLANQRAPVLALRMTGDWLVPAASIDFLLGKMPHAQAQVDVLAGTPGAGAAHFEWMKQPDEVAQRFAKVVANA